MDNQTLRFNLINTYGVCLLSDEQLTFITTNIKGDMQALSIACWQMDELISLSNKVTKVVPSKQTKLMKQEWRNRLGLIDEGEHSYYDNLDKENHGSGQT